MYTTHTDPHLNVTTRQYNWFITGRSYFYPRYTLFFACMAIAYYPLMCLGISVMKHREPFQLKRPLLLWNAFLSIGSAYGAYHILRYIYNTPMTFHVSVCNHELLYTSEVAWIIAAFNGTKIFEWLDTLFLILRKKKIIFLHWFHHLLTFLYCWHATLYSYRSDASGMWFAGMNLIVHAIMYMYYALAAVNIYLPFSWLITIIQTLQMVIGCTVLVYTVNCKDSWRNNWHGNLIAAGMYATYLLLFSKLLFSKIFKKKNN